MLTPKLEYVSKCLSQIPILHGFRHDGEALIRKFEKLSEKRHDLVHGAIASLSLEEGAFRFTKLDVKDGFHVVREFRFDSAEFPQLTKDLIDLSAETTALAKKILECVEKGQ